MKGFGRREFQLMLLRRMADFQPGLVEQAIAELGATHAEYMVAHNRWQSMLHARRASRGLDLYRAALGPPESEQDRRVGDVTVRACRWRLAGLWPDLHWEAVVGERRVVLHGWLVRASGTPMVGQPWGCVVGDVLERFPEARQRDPDVPSQWLVELGDARLWFVHGLLQAIR
ncbi:hypothetical protein [Allorhizocola rhizosphaerae]|uniref:hypothetical protein n=1 Tax=Allorhizocola rhizosphaerae TaxID=1872709 RepID=UPI000E3E0CBE|nr:hypothetical protein [Allorhizocola rhizosphaerae]